MSIPRATTVTGRLAALGFADTDNAERLLASELRLDPGGAHAELVAAIAAAPDPDLALAALARMPGRGELISGLRADQGLRRRLLAVAGASAALGDYLCRHPADWRLLAGAERARPAADQVRAALLGACGACPDDAVPVACRDDVADPASAVRIAYRQQLLQLAAADLTGAAALDEVLTGLADLATAGLEAALAVARSMMPAGSAPCRLAVIAMGKCGARELNYASDVDVIFVAEPADPGRDEDAALRAAAQLAATMITVCSGSGPEAPMFPVDANLRPEGRDGPLVRTLASHRAYYGRWAKTWEFQALLKARAAAGDGELAEAYLAAVTPMVWDAAQRDNFVTDVQEMRRRVIASLPAVRAGRELKLGPGGLRDIEFAVQLLQLVHGRADETLRAPATLDALAALGAGGYVGRQDAAGLGAAYRFLRAVEHLLQLRQLRRTHTLPEDPAVLRAAGRALRTMRYAPDAAGSQPGSAGSADTTAAAAPTAPAAPPQAGGPPQPGTAGSEAAADPAEQLITAWRQHASQARRLHEKLFYRPLLNAVARLPGDVVRLSPQAAAERLEALGYADPDGALRHIESLTSGVARKAAIQRAMLPALLGWFADAPRPDAGLLAFRQVSEALGSSPWYLRLLRDDYALARRLARLLASGQYATGLLLRAPEAVAMLADDAQLGLRPAAELAAEAGAIVRRHPDAEGTTAGLLALRRRELFRAAAADLLGLAGPEQTAEALTAAASVIIAAALQAAVRLTEQSAAPLPTRISVIAMGRFGGHEMGYGSDADVLFVHDPAPAADEEAAARAAHSVADELRRLLGKPGPDPPLQLDAGLRPEGRQGPLVRTLASYRAYYRRWSVPWEAQALLRAEPAAGDAGLGERFGRLADEIRYPAGGIGEQFVTEIRRIKARVEAERMPRGTEPALHLKLGPGGLSDTEWTVQLLQLRHGDAVPELRTTRTLAALAAAGTAGLISAPDEQALSASWLLATRIRNAVMLVRGRGSDTLPTAQPELAAVAQLLGYPPGQSQDLVQDYRRAARRARSVMERVFYA